MSAQSTEERRGSPKILVGMVHMLCFASTVWLVFGTLFAVLLVGVITLDRLHWIPFVVAPLCFITFVVAGGLNWALWNKMLETSVRYARD